MKYKVGDEVKIKTWEELVDEFGLNSNGHINLPHGYWTKNENTLLPSNRIITIIRIDGDEDYYFNIYYVYSSMIKCHANEYYLQEIKDELQKG